MSKEIIEHTTVIDPNTAAMHSLMVMEQWGNGEKYDEATWIERGRQAARKTMEGMFELGRALIVLKEHTEHGRFGQIVQEQFGIEKSAAARLMSATRRFATPQMQKAAPKLMDLGKSKLLELLVEEDDTLAELADGGEVNGMTLDDVDRMSVREVRLALREARENAEAKDKLIADKSAKIDQLAEKLAKQQSGSRPEPKPQDVAADLTQNLAAREVGIRSEVSRLQEMFEQLSAHGEAHGFDHRPAMVGCLNQIIRDCETLRERFALPQEAPTDAKPAWLDGE